MGYDTKYTLHATDMFIEDVNEDTPMSVCDFQLEEQIVKTLKSLSYFGHRYNSSLSAPFVKTLSDFNNLYLDDSMTWYDHSKDMKAISKQFPSVLFRLRGVGEDNHDMWVKYYKGGREQVCPAVIYFVPCKFVNQ